ncbi:MAG: PAS domain-containing protein [Leptolyngbyaceae cyanobacterium bins.349]|nr:PAS domain-containing protein [Leptolyngbyaceae cyanobacterium bins.349]
MRWVTRLKNRFLTPCRRSQQIARTAAALVVLVGVLVLVGWSFNIPLVKSGIPDSATMKANTALCFILAGTSLGLQTCNRRTLLTSRVIKGCAIATGVIGLLALSQYLWGINLGIDELLFPHDAISPNTPYPGRMAINTAVNFVLVSSALWLCHRRERQPQPRQQSINAMTIAQSLAAATIFIALQATIGYLYNIRVLYQPSLLTNSMAVTTALTFLILSAGVLALHSDRGWMRTVTSNTIGGIVARQLIPAVIILPLVLGWLVLEGQRAGWYDANFRLSLMVMSLVVVSVGLIGRSAAILNRIDDARKRSADLLQSSEERLQLALRGAGQGIWDWDVETGNLTWDDRSKAIFGLPPDFPVTYEWHLNALHPDDRQPVSDAAATALRDRGEFDAEYRTVHPDGTMRWVLARGRGYYDTAGRPYRMSGTVLDITDRKQAELALREKEQQLQELSDSMPQFVWMCDAEGELNYVNRQWIEYSGLTLEQGRDPEQIAATYHPDDVQRAFEQWAIALETRQPCEFEARFKRAVDGEYRWFMVRAVPMLDDQGQVRCWYGTSTDIHDRKLAELNNQFLTDLDSRLRQLSDADAMAWETVNRVGEYLQVDLCLWHTINLQAGTTVVQQDWNAADFDSVKGEYRLSDYILPQMVNHYQTGQPLVITDIATHDYTASVADNFAQHKIRAILGVPWIESGCWVAAFAVNASSVRQWRSDEVALLQAVVARLWSIIEQTRATQALRAQEERTRLATEAAQLGMWFWDIPKDELVWTDRCNVLFGFPPEAQISYDMFLNALHPDDRDRTHAAVTRALEQGVEYDIEYRSVWSDGTVHWIAAKGRTFFDASGKAIRMMGTAQCISDRKQAEADLQERTHHIQLLYETTRDLLSTDQPLTLVDALFAKLKPMIGLDVYINYWLDAERQQLQLMFYAGLPEATARDIEWLEIDCAVCGTVAQQRSQIVQSDVQNSTDPKAELIKTLGLTAYSCQPLVAQGKLFGTLGFGSRSRTKFTDAETRLFQALCDQIAIALDRSELTLSLQQQTAELTQTNRLKDEFLAALSHELRTPLNPILGWTRLLKEQRLNSAKAAEALNVIERSAKQQLSLVTDLLDVSSVIQGKLSLGVNPVDLTAIVRTAIESVQFAAQAKRIAVSVSQGDSNSLAGLPVLGDSDRLRQVFWNLLSNAVKFTPEGGRVEVNLSIVTNGNGNRYAQVCVTDNGIGIAPEFLPHVFDHFRQADGSTSRRYGGLGLGLSIVRHLVEMHGGTVGAESPGLGQGATFTVKLPLREAVIPITNETSPFRPDDTEQLPVPQSHTPLSTPTSLSRTRILVVDDDLDNLDLLRFLLQEHGAIVTAVSSAREALQIATDNPPDLIIGDIGMPGMNGYEFIQQVREIPQAQQIPALAFTAFARQEDQERVFSSGFQAYLSKPVDPLELLAVLTQLVTTSSKVLN